VLLGDDIIDAPVPGTRQLLDVFRFPRSRESRCSPCRRSGTQLYGVVSGQRVKERLYHVECAGRENRRRGRQPTEPRRDWAATCCRPEIFDILEKNPPGKGGEIQLTDGLQTLARQASLHGLEFEASASTPRAPRLIRGDAHLCASSSRAARDLRPLMRRLLD
jgi:UTP--glucose-1-phosphate uridylyltransferase